MFRLSKHPSRGLHVPQVEDLIDSNSTEENPSDEPNGRFSVHAYNFRHYVLIPNTKKF